MSVGLAIIENSHGLDTTYVGGFTPGIRKTDNKVWIFESVGNVRRNNIVRLGNR
jgi:hypothetical protein